MPFSWSWFYFRRLCASRSLHRPLGGRNMPEENFTLRAAGWGHGLSGPDGQVLGGAELGRDQGPTGSPGNLPGFPGQPTRISGQCTKETHSLLLFFFWNAQFKCCNSSISLCFNMSTKKDNWFYQNPERLGVEMQVQILLLPLLNTMRYLHC